MSENTFNLPRSKGLLNALFALENQAFPTIKNQTKTPALLPMSKSDRDQLADAVRPILMDTTSIKKGIPDDVHTGILRKHVTNIARIEAILERTDNLRVDLKRHWRFKAEGIELTTPESVFSKIKERLGIDDFQAETSSPEIAT